jgi:hypothetical protein
MLRDEDLEGRFGIGVSGVDGGPADIAANLPVTVLALCADPRHARIHEPRLLPEGAVFEQTHRLQQRTEPDVQAVDRFTGLKIIFVNHDRGQVAEGPRLGGG